jgi:hypothetical protein
MRLAVPVLLLFPLLACTPLVGDWSGPLQCGDVAETATFSIEWGGNDYEGEGTVFYQGQANGSDVDIEVEFSVEIDGAIDGDGELDVSAESQRCTYTQGGTSLAFECTSDLDEGNAFTWDHGDEIDVRGNCDGTLERER